jgi:hypothetical protein
VSPIAIVDTSAAGVNIDNGPLPRPRNDCRIIKWTFVTPIIEYVVHGG